MAMNKFDICSRALNTIGQSSIQTFNETNRRSGMCNDIWDSYSRYLLSIYTWSFTRKKAQLGRLVTTPVNEYKYEFELPGDVLTIRAVYSSGGTGISPVQNFEIFGNRIYSDLDALWIDYEYYVDATAWPYWFTYFAIKALAVELGEAFPIDDNRLNKLKVDTWGPAQDNRRGGLFGATMAIDAKQQPAEPITDFPFVYDRFV